MKKPLSFITLSLITLLAVFLFAPKSILADGMMIKLDPYSNRWDYSGENNQQAFINYGNGLQKMIITIGLKGEKNNGVVWLFPIPANPNKVAVDIVKNLPQFTGEEISKKAKSNLDDTTKFLLSTQIYTIPFLMKAERIYGNFPVPEGVNTINTLSGMAEQGIEQDVIVFKHLEKEGITSEIITAKTAFGLYDYLKNKGLKIESGSIPVLDNYIGKDYSFVASWISTPENVVSPQVGVFVTFPTKDIYYPLLPTSVYESEIVPATIRVIGYVKPKIFQDIKNYTKTNYYIDRNTSFAEDLKNFYSGQNQNIKYTKIEINAPAKFLTDDLWIKNQAPIKTYFSNFIANHPAITTIILLILTSIITGILAGLIIFKDLRRKPIKLGLIGLSNFLTIFGLFITTALVGTKNKNETVEPILNEIKQKRYFWKRRVAMILFLFAIPFLVFGLFLLPSLISELSYDLSHFSVSWVFSKDNFFIPILILIIYVLPIVALSVGFLIKRIKPEDKNLFKQLKLSHYSSWSFQPKDKLKIAFVPVFSVFFLIVSWLLVKLIWLTV